MSSLRHHLFPWWGYGQALVVIAVFASSPLVGTLIANTLAALAGCQLIDHSVTSCHFFGMDWGPGLFILSLLTWFTTITFPIAWGALLALMVIITTHRIAWRLMPKAH